MAQAPHSRVVAQGALLDGEVAHGAWRLELHARAVGLSRAPAGLDPQGLEVGVGVAHVVARVAAWRLELAHQRDDLRRQPLGLGVRAQQQANLGRRRPAGAGRGCEIFGH